MFQFSDQNVPIVRRRNIFTFSPSSPEPLNQFKSNLAQSLLGLKGLKYVRMKGTCPIPTGR